MGNATLVPITPEVLQPAPVTFQIENVEAVPLSLIGLKNL